MVEELLKYGGVEITDCRGQTPLHVAAYHGEAECVKLLCCHGAQISARSIDAKIVENVKNIIFIKMIDLVLIDCR